MRARARRRAPQVLRTLAPPLTGDLCGTLLRCMLQCLEPGLQVRPLGTCRASVAVPNPVNTITTDLMR
jgi:hypothetical protein